MENGRNEEKDFFDLHVHSHYSRDCKSNPKSIIKEAERRGLSGLAITDHNTTDFHHKVRIETDLLIIPGIEVSTNKGHIIGLGIKSTIPKRLSIEETIEKILEFGGEVIVPHPFDITRKGIGKRIFKLEKIFVETQNGSCWLQYFNNRAKNFARRKNFPETGGSDSHRIQDVGMAYTICSKGIESIDDLLESIRRRKTKGGGAHLSLPEKFIRAFQIHL